MVDTDPNQRGIFKKTQKDSSIEQASLVSPGTQQETPNNPGNRQVQRYEPFYERAEQLKSGEIIITFEDGQELRGFRARLVFTMASHIGPAAALSKANLYNAVYGEDMGEGESKLNNLISATNPIIADYQRKITSTGMTAEARRSGERTNYYLEVLRKQRWIPRELQASRLGALAMLGREPIPSMDEIIQALGPSEKTGRMLLWQQAQRALGNNLNYLYMRAVPTKSRQSTATPKESKLWESLRESVQEQRDYPAREKLWKRIEEIATLEKARRKGNLVATAEIKKLDPLTDYDKALLAVLMQENRPLLESLNYPLLPESLILALILEDVDQAFEQPVESNIVTPKDIQSDRRVALGKVLGIVRSSNFEDLHREQPPTGRELLEHFWVLSDIDPNLELTLGKFNN